jgi:hypothetical protein
MKLNGFAHKFLDLFNGVRRTDATWKIWNVGTEIASRVFDNDCVLTHEVILSNPACL